MHGLTLCGVEKIQFATDLADPQIENATDVVVLVDRSGICGSDLHQYHGRESVSEGTIPGHEFVGEVVAIGDRVRRFSVGDYVFSPFSTSCGACYFCETGLSARCQHSQIFGYLPPAGVKDEGRGIQGAQAQWVRVPLADTTLLPVPNREDPEQALLLGDNFTTGFYCADSGGIRPGDLTVVLGCGAVGLSAICAAWYLGSGVVVAVDLVESRLQRAESLGAIVVLPDAAHDCLMEHSSRRGYRGADNVLEAVGLPAAQQLAFQLVRPGGVISAVGMHTASQFEFSPADAYNRNLTYRAGRCPVRSYLDRILTAVGNGDLSVPTEQIVTHRHVPLSDGAAAYRMFSQRDDDCVKVVFSRESTR
jgi:2-desacetyl-2-hydroxyethyl bacteriochlorophyllide A dehydrogenase